MFKLTFRSLKPDQQQQPSSSHVMTLSCSESNLCIGKSMHHVYSSIREESFGMVSRSSREMIHSGLKYVSRSQSFPDASENCDLVLVSQSVNSVTASRSSFPRLKSSTHDIQSRQMVLRQLEKDAKESGDDPAGAAAAADGVKRRFPGGDDNDEDEDELCARTGICRVRRGFNIQRKLSTKAERFATTPFEAEESQLNGGDDDDDDLVDETKKNERNPPMQSKSTSTQNSGKAAVEAKSEASENLAPTAAATEKKSSAESVKRFKTKIYPSLANETNTKPKKRCPCCAVQ